MARRISILSKLKVSQKIWTLVIIAGVIVVLLAVFAVVLGNITKSSIQEEARLSQYQVPITQLQMEMMRNRMNISDTGSVPPDIAPAVAESIAETDKSVMNLYQKIVSLGGEKDLPAIKDFDKKYQEWINFRDSNITPLVLNQEREKYFELATAEGEGSNQALIDSYTKMVDDAQEQMLNQMKHARERVDANQLTMIITIAVAGLIGILLMVLMGRHTISLITKPVLNIQESLQAMSNGDLTQKPTIYSQDEIGHMAGSIITTQQGLRDLITSTIEAVNEVEATVDKMLVPTRNAAEAAVNSRNSSEQVAAQANSISSNIQTVAAGAEEMSASIREISSNANEAARVASEASQAAEETNRVVTKLGESSSEIGEVIDSITSIAEQTNLLALNATIEAARAGDAGKGFAVVAGEVKDLAAETSTATETIGRKIDQIQTDTREAVEAIERISQIIASINDYQTTIAAAVEEQTATTNEMSRSVSEAADNASTMADSISQIAQMTVGATGAMSEISDSAETLSQESAQLREKIGAFKY